MREPNGNGALLWLVRALAQHAPILRRLGRAAPGPHFERADLDAIERGDVVLATTGSVDGATVSRVLEHLPARDGFEAYEDRGLLVRGLDGREYRYRNESWDVLRGWREHYWLARAFHDDELDGEAEEQRT